MPCAATTWYCLCLRLPGIFLTLRTAAETVSLLSSFLVSDTEEPGSRTKRQRLPFFFCSRPTMVWLWPVGEAEVEEMRTREKGRMVLKTDWVGQYVFQPFWKEEMFKAVWIGDSGGKDRLAVTEDNQLCVIAAEGVQVLCHRSSLKTHQSLPPGSHIPAYSDTHVHFLTPLLVSGYEADFWQERLTFTNKYLC